MEPITAGRASIRARSLWATFICRPRRGVTERWSAAAGTLRGRAKTVAWCAGRCCRHAAKAGCGRCPASRVGRVRPWIRVQRDRKGRVLCWHARCTTRGGRRPPGSGSRALAHWYHRGAPAADRVPACCGNAHATASWRARRIDPAAKQASRCSTARIGGVPCCIWF